MNILETYKSLRSFVEAIENAVDSGETVSEETLELVKDLKVALSFIYDMLKFIYGEMKEGRITK